MNGNPQATVREKMSGKCQHRTSPAAAGPLTDPLPVDPPALRMTSLSSDRQCPDRRARRGCFQTLQAFAPNVTPANVSELERELVLFGTQLTGHLHPVPARFSHGRAGPRNHPANRVPWKRSLNMARGVRTAALTRQLVLGPRCEG